MKYNTFDLEVSETDKPYQYQLIARSSTLGEAIGQTKIDSSNVGFIKLLQQIENASISPSDLKNLGIKFYRYLFVDKIGLLFNRAFGEIINKDSWGLRIRLRINPAELAFIPWEFLYLPDRHLFLAASVKTPLSRYINLPEPIRDMACPKIVRILAVIPQNSGLDTNAEHLILKKISTKLKNKIAVDFLDGDATITGIRTALSKREYHILHYAGHGEFKKNEAFLIFDHALKQNEPIASSRFAHFFLDYPSIRLVILNACKGAKRSSHQALVGAAPQLLLRGVPAVIAMQYNISNDDAVLFATEFYRKLCSRQGLGQIETAISDARKALLQAHSSNHIFGNPVLYLRSSEGRIFGFTSSKNTKDKIREVRSASNKKIVLTIDMELEHFDKKEESWLQYGLAKFLEIPTESVRITSVEQGSVKVTIELPTQQDVDRLLIAHTRKDARLANAIAPLKARVLNNLVVQELFLRCAAVPSDEMAWKEFFHRYENDIKSAIYRVTGFPPKGPFSQLVDDILQKFDERLLANNRRTLLAFRGTTEKEAKAFLRNIAANVAVAVIHKERMPHIATVSQKEEDSSGMLVDSSIGDEDYMLLKKTIDDSLEQIVHGPNKERNILIFKLAAFEGLSPQDIANIPGLQIGSTHAVEQQITRIRRKLRQYLEKK